MKKDDRPTFYLDNDLTKPVRAGGVLFYRHDVITNTYNLLMIYSRNSYEDFGGCSDSTDQSLEQMICREVEEESNGIFGKKYVSDCIKGLNPIYIKYCKYVLYFVKIEEKYDPTIFGDVEICDNISRNVEWINYSDINQIKLNFRLTMTQVTNHMENLFI
ncbi:MAG: hypothetical protein Barrevirus3_29 [Barrevirus sp.]|uniref:Uncharacterized protein n=1 Tax=Barrevirus sp. TaxID=2487763 RepID=A0A3G4ZU07_9VIRU|nr:MAG: hypothetical protein Barrevirus3_29 [Barrevirus sp.]